MLGTYSLQSSWYANNSILSSDARAGNVVNDRIRPTLESGSLVNSTKPVLVVIDEIDGATGAGENVSNYHAKLITLPITSS